MAQGVTFWVPTHAPLPLVTHPGSVPTFLSYYAHGSPLGVGTSRVRSPYTGTKTMALEPPFSYCSEVSGPSGYRPLHSLSYPWVSRDDTVDALNWRRHASSWRRLILAML